MQTRVCVCLCVCASYCCTVPRTDSAAIQTVIMCCSELHRRLIDPHTKIYRSSVCTRTIDCIHTQDVANIYPISVCPLLYRVDDHPFSTARFSIRLPISHHCLRSATKNAHASRTHILRASLTNDAINAHFMTTKNHYKLAPLELCVCVCALMHCNTPHIQYMYRICV